jgi:hypothetical protein
MDVPEAWRCGGAKCGGRVEVVRGEVTAMADGGGNCVPLSHRQWRIKG